MPRWVIGLDDLGRGDVARAGGKGANLGEMRKIGGVCVPDGFVVTTEADRAGMPAEAEGEVRAALARLGGPVAVRSSATAEDLPTASFAGQQDTFLGVDGVDAVLDAVRRCRASLHAELAVVYRERAGIDHAGVAMAVVVQRLVPAEVSGVAFTADPVSGDRRVVAIEAVRGLGEALVSGRATPESVYVRDGVVTSRSGHGVLPDAVAVELAALGRRIEAHFGAPQDLEWCLAGGVIHVVQARPITTLFPIPVTDAPGNRVYLSVGHQQMMTDAMAPLGLSVWRMVALRPMVEAGGRLFVDVTAPLSSPARAATLAMVERSDPLIGDALQTLLDRGFLPPAPDSAPRPPAMAADPAVVAALLAESEASLVALERTLAGLGGAAAFDAILADLPEFGRLLLDPRSHAALFSGIEAKWWLDDHLRDWLGDPALADAITVSVPHNPTSEMGLSLLDVADVVRRHQGVVAHLEAGGALDTMGGVPGGPEAEAALRGWLDRYGARCVGEIDITRTRWAEEPAGLIPLILGNVRHFPEGERARRFQRGLDDANRAIAQIGARLRALVDGEAKAAEAQANIDRVRTFAGYREYPKYGMIRRFFLYKQAILRAVDGLVADGVLRAPDDAWFLHFDELHAAARTRTADLAVVDERRAALQVWRRLTPPRVLTSDGEALVGSYRKEVPPGSLLGLGVSAGVVEGRARIAFDLARADLQPGDILVTPCTDPSWTPAFVTVAGLVTEVGGRMTHGAVIAREYGLPAVVGVHGATRHLRDGDWIRVDGALGVVTVVRRDP